MFNMVNFVHETFRSNSVGSNGGGICVSNRALLVVLMAAAVFVPFTMLNVPRSPLVPAASSAHAIRATYMFSVPKIGGVESIGGGRSGVKQAEKPFDMRILIQGYRKDTTSQAAVVSRNGQSEETGQN